MNRGRTAGTIMLGAGRRWLGAILATSLIAGAAQAQTPAQRGFPDTYRTPVTLRPADPNEVIPPSPRQAENSCRSYAKRVTYQNPDLTPYVPSDRNIARLCTGAIVAEEPPRCFATTVRNEGSFQAFAKCTATARRYAELARMNAAKSLMYVNNTDRDYHAVAVGSNRAGSRPYYSQFVIPAGRVSTPDLDFVDTGGAAPRYSSILYFTTKSAADAYYRKMMGLDLSAALVEFSRGLSDEYALRAADAFVSTAFGQKMPSINPNGRFRQNGAFAVTNAMITGAENGTSYEPYTYAISQIGSQVVVKGWLPLKRKVAPDGRVIQEGAIALAFNEPY